MPEKTDIEKVAELLNVEILPPLDSAGQTHDFCSEFSMLLRSALPSASSGLLV
jgi:hypothetical protein